VVIPVSSVNGSLNVGHVLLGNSSSGFLETVNEVVQEETAKFVYTELSVCFRNFSNFKTYVQLQFLNMYYGVKVRIRSTLTIVNSSKVFPLFCLVSL
jgi:hypothetical protein